MARSYANDMYQPLGLTHRTKIIFSATHLTPNTVQNQSCTDLQLRLIGLNQLCFRFPVSIPLLIPPVMANVLLGTLDATLS